MGCALLLPAGAVVVEAGVVPALPKPQRSLWARVAHDGVEVTLCSWHAPNAAGDGRRAKMAGYAAMDRWLAGARRPLILGADLNTWQDPVDLAVPPADDPFLEEHLFVGPDPGHRLVTSIAPVWRRAVASMRCGPRAMSGP